jgi:hypothetical protein
MRQHKRVQPYVVQANFLYDSCLDHIKFNHSLIHALIERWRCEIHTFHLRYIEMTPTLQGMVVFLGLPINGRVVTSTSVCNKMVLCEQSFGLTPLHSELKRVAHVLSGLRRHFLHHQMMVTRKSCRGTKSIMFKYVDYLL